VNLVYFASVREALGMSAERRDVPEQVRTVGELVSWLATQSDAHALALNDPVRLRFALDQNMVAAGALLGNAQEFAIFPPVTGG
jgi:molybdopterin synthase sulfur carrier subunit